MAHYNTILNQLTAIFPRHDFEYLAKVHHNGQKFRSYNRWSQFLAMTIAQLAGSKVSEISVIHFGLRVSVFIIWV